MKSQKFHLEHIFRYLEIEKLNSVDDVKWPAPEIAAADNRKPATEKSPPQATETVSLSEVVSYPLESMAIIAFHRIYNQIIIHGLQPGLLEARLLLPQNLAVGNSFAPALESDLQRLCDRYKLKYAPLQKVAHPAIADPLLFVNMIAQRQRIKKEVLQSFTAATQLILINPVAAIPVVFLSELYGKKITHIFDPLFLKLCREIKLENHISVHQFSRLRKSFWQRGRIYLPGEGGISACCYEICYDSGMGIELDLESLPMLVPAKILCDLFRLDPLCTDSTGCILILSDADSATQLVEACLEKNIIAAQIGELSDTHKSCIFTGLDGQKSRMYKPPFDELMRYRFRN